MGLVIALLAAAPTLAHAFWQPSFLVDDWGFAAKAREGIGPFWSASDMPSRPLQATFHGLTFLVFGDHPVPHLLLLAALNGVAAFLVLRVALRWVTPRAALLVALCWVVLANRGASRLWISTGPTMVAVVLLLAAALTASKDRPRWVLTTLLVILSTLSYEGGVLIGVAIVVLAAWRSDSEASTRRVARVVGAVGAVTLTAASVYLNSPKTAVAGAADGSGSPLSALLGSALLPEGLRSAATVPLLAMLVAAATVVVSDLRVPSSVRLLVSGAVVTVLGIAPFLAAGFPIATDGMLDRGNTFAALGVAVLLAGVLNQLWNLGTPIAVGMSTLCLLVLASANVADVRDVHSAERDGEAVLTEMEALDVGPSQRLVLAPMPNRGGYAAFGYDSIGPAFLIRTGRTLDVHDTITAQQLSDDGGLKLRFGPSGLRPDGQR